MDVEEIVRSFEQNPPRKVCFKPDSPEGGYGFHPLSHLRELIGCGSILLVVILLVGFVAGHCAIWFAKAYACVLLSLAVLLGIVPLISASTHKRLARYGVAAIGKVLSRTEVLVHNDTPAPPTDVLIEYTFETYSGAQVTGRRHAMSGWYNQLVQEGPIIVIYLPEKPEVHEPYNSLRYRICI